MRIRILMTGAEQEYMRTEAEMLKDRGFLVYTCEEENIEEAISEIKPDLVFVNPHDPGLHSTKVYHELLDNIKYASIPVIYTLSEDDVYLVNRKRTASRDKRNMITDNIVDGIKCALLADSITPKKRVRINRNIQFPYYAFRA
ncbi:hypothetical protein [Polluticoccus soli]|uniref:hypothetical protein n=1 Tax=Polluticoccus soli TaxID=3034150 RepID=UPI0023E20044|nr:hypothetical protein [Flavipsychrobacter sp. JY13-12]